MGSVMACWKDGGENREIEFALESFAILKKHIQGKKFLVGNENIGYLDLAMEHNSYMDLVPPITHSIHAYREENKEI